MKLKVIQSIDDSAKDEIEEFTETVKVIDIKVTSEIYSGKFTHYTYHIFYEDKLPYKAPPIGLGR